MKKGDRFESLIFTGEEFSDFNDSGKKRYWIYVQWKMMSSRIQVLLTW